MAERNKRRADKMPALTKRLRSTTGGCYDIGQTEARYFQFTA